MKCLILLMHGATMKLIYLSFTIMTLYCVTILNGCFVNYCHGYYYVHILQRNFSQILSRSMIMIG